MRVPAETLQNHVAAGTLLGVEPEIAATRLAQADPFVLAMVAAHLHDQAGRVLPSRGSGPWPWPLPGDGRAAGAAAPALRPGAVRYPPVRRAFPQLLGQGLQLLDAIGLVEEGAAGAPARQAAAGAAPAAG